MAAHWWSGDKSWIWPSVTLGLLGLQFALLLNNPMQLYKEGNLMEFKEAYSQVSLHRVAPMSNMPFQVFTKEAIKGMFLSFSGTHFPSLIHFSKLYFHNMIYWLHAWKPTHQRAHTSQGTPCFQQQPGKAILSSKGGAAAAGVVLLLKLQEHHLLGKVAGSPTAKIVRYPFTICSFGI